MQKLKRLVVPIAPKRGTRFAVLLVVTAGCLGHPVLSEEPDDNLRAMTFSLVSEAGEKSVVVVDVTRALSGTGALLSAYRIRITDGHRVSEHLLDRDFIMVREQDLCADRDASGCTRAFTDWTVHGLYSPIGLGLGRRIQDRALTIFSVDAEQVVPIKQTAEDGGLRISVPTITGFTDGLTVPARSFMFDKSLLPSTIVEGSHVWRVADLKLGDLLPPVDSWPVPARRSMVAVPKALELPGMDQDPEQVGFTLGSALAEFVQANGDARAQMAGGCLGFHRLNLPVGTTLEPTVPPTSSRAGFVTAIRNSGGTTYWTYSVARDAFGNLVVEDVSSSSASAGSNCEETVNDRCGSRSMDQVRDEVTQLFGIQELDGMSIAVGQARWRTTADYLHTISWVPDEVADGGNFVTYSPMEAVWSMSVCSFLYAVASPSAIP